MNDLGLDSQQRHGNFLFAEMSRPALSPNQPRIQWVPEGDSPGLEQDVRQLTICCKNISLPVYAFMTCAETALPLASLSQVTDCTIGKGASCNTNQSIGTF
jgi:hypothetical protein